MACMGEISKKPVVVGDELLPRDVMTIVYTLDHRYGDGALMGLFSQIMKDILEDPENFSPDNYKASIPYDQLGRNKKNE